jgi:hypothetical protein
MVKSVSLFGMIEGYLIFQSETVKEALKKVKESFIFHILFQKKQDE